MTDAPMCARHAELKVQWRCGIRNGVPRLRWQCKSCETERRREVNANAAKREWDHRNKHKRKAHKQVENALQRGALVREPCQGCGSHKVQAHHDDYDRPLDVRWLCSPCHGAHHRNARSYPATSPPP